MYGATHGTLAHVITTVAGNSGAGFGADGGPATAANLYLSPISGLIALSAGGVAINSNGDIFIADTLNNRIRK